MVPAQQRFQPDHPPGIKFDLRLIEQFELVVLDGRMQAFADGDPFAHLLIEFANMEAEAGAALILGAIERQVGFGHHRLGVGDVSAIGNHADAGAGVNLIAVDGDRRRNRSADLCRQRLGAGNVAHVLLQQRELIAAKAGDHIGIAHAVLQPVGDDFQENVAGGMPQRIVDILEMIEIEIKHRESMSAAFGARKGQLQPVEKRDAIGQAGQRIGACELP